MCETKQIDNLNKEELLNEEEQNETIVQATLPWKKRRSLVVWVYTLRPVRQLRKFGIIHHISKKMKYVVIYMDDVEIKKNCEQIEKLHFVRSVELSFRPDVAVEYAKPDEDDDGFSFQEVGTTIKLAEEV